VHDTLLFYTKTDRYTWNPIYQPLPQETIDQWYNNVEAETGHRYNRADLTASGVRSGASGAPWRGIDVTAKGRHGAIPGVIGGVLGAYVLTSIDAGTAKPFVLAYLTALGLYLFYRGVMHRHTERTPKIVSPLGLVGGFLDAAGGGGWGGIVTSNLLVQGSNPRKTIGTVNTAEFFVTITISATFIAALGWEAFTIATLGLLIGGVAAAPFGAWIAKRINPDRLLTFVGALLTLTSGYALYRVLSKAETLAFIGGVA
jgi:hypothetical protein